MDIDAIAETIRANLLPDQSRERYEKALKEFQNWMLENGISIIEEKVVLVYLSKKSETVAPTTLWSIFSMIKKCLPAANMGNYHEVISYLKKTRKGYRPKKAETFTQSQFHSFVADAPDTKFLLAKVILILGTAGAMRSKEIFELKKCNVVDCGSYIQVAVLETKNDLDRKFVVVNADGIICADLIRKYMALRPITRTDPRFLVAYQKGKCVNSAVGYSNVRSIPRIVSKFLGIPIPVRYTGHALRRTSATLLADAGADLLQIKKHGGWKSSTVAEGYVDQGHPAKLKAAHKILGVRNTTAETPSTSRCPATEVSGSTSSTLMENMNSMIFRSISITGATNCHFTINVNNQ